MRTHGVNLEALLDCRLAVEPMLAKLAAANRTPVELEDLERIHASFVASVKNVATYKRVNLEWHLAVARASRNEPLTAVMEAISTPIMDAAGDRNVTTPDIRQAAVKAHEAIMRAIRDQDVKAAFAGMERHLSAYGEVARSKQGPPPSG